MSLLWPEGFDAYSTLNHLYRAGYGYTYQTQGETPYEPSVTNGGRFSGKAVFVPWQTASLYRDVSPSGIAIGIQAAFKHSDLSKASNEYLLKLLNNSGADLCFGLVLKTNGSLIAADANGGVIATSDSGIITTGSYYYLEIWATICGSGSILVKINGKTIFNENHLDLTQGSPGADRWALFGASDDPGYGTTWDDIIVLDDAGSRLNGLIGDSRFDPYTVDADTAVEQWLLSAGSDSYALIDDPIPGGPDDDSAYIYSNTNGHKTRCEVEAVSGGYLHAICLISTLIKTSTFECTARSLFYSNGTEETGPTITDLSDTSYKTYRDIYELNPDGDKLWHSDDASNLEIGAELVSAGSTQARLTRSAIEVLRPTYPSASALHSFVIP